MFCTKCGAQLPEGSFFCTNCGSKIKSEPTPDVSSIVPPIMDQSYGYAQPPQPKKKSKALLWVMIGVVAALAVAAVLIFVVFTPGGSGFPFSGNTTQTRFANDVVGVFSNAFDGLPNDKITSEILEKPFDMQLAYTTELSGIKTNIDLDAAYDEAALGLNITTSSDYSNSEFAEYFSDMEPLGSTVKMLLLDDVLYADQDGTVSGLRFDTDADLSKPMSLKERIASLFNSDKNSQIDYLKLSEMLLNSIDEKCFEKSAKETTLTLDGHALSEALDVFADKLEDDKELNDALSDIIKEISGYSYDMSNIISLAAPMLSDSDFELVWTVEYNGGKPDNMEIVFEESGSQVFEATFSSENKGDERELSLEITADGETAKMELLLTKAANGFDFKGTISVPGSDEITIIGDQQISDGHLSGAMDITSAEMSISVAYEGAISIGMPKDAVKDDSRFEMNTNGAAISDLGNMSSLPGIIRVN